MIKTHVHVNSLLLIGIFLIFSCTSPKRGYVSTSRSKPKTSKRVEAFAPDKTLSDQRKFVIAEAHKYLGIHYEYGGKKPQTGFDCSGFTTFVYRKTSAALSGPSYHQAKSGTKKQISNLRAGDLLFFGTEKKVSHVAIVVKVKGDMLQVIHSTSSRGVVLTDVNKSKYWKKKLLFGRDILG